MPTVSIPDLFRASASLVGSSPSSPASDLKEVLQRRLAHYYASSGRDAQVQSRDASLEDVQLATATESLYVVERLHAIWNAPPQDAPPHSAGTIENAVGTRDMAQLRTLISIIFKWAVDPLLSRIVAAIPAQPAPRFHKGAKIIDLTTVPEDYAILSSCVVRLFHLLLPHGVSSPMSQTVIASTLLLRHLADLLKPCIVLGWLPKSLATDSVHPMDSLRSLVVHILSILPASQTIAALGSLLLEAPSTLPYVRKACGFLLSKQLLRPNGVSGLLSVVFGEEDVSNDEAPLEKLEHVGKLLGTLPANMKPQEYYSAIIPRMVSLINADATRVPPAHRRAVAFSLSRMLAADSSPDSPGSVSSVLLPILHRPFLDPTPGLSVKNEGAPIESAMTPSASLVTLQTLLTNADPSPTFVSSLLTPIVPALYAIMSASETTKTSDPAAKEAVKGYLATWGRLVGAPEGTNTLWRVIDGEGGDWKMDVVGNLTRIEKADEEPSLALFTPGDLKKAEESGDLDADSNMLDLRPDPARFVRYIKTLARSDISSEVFVRLLEAYRETKADQDADPFRTLLYLQLIVQIQAQLSTEDPSSSILSKPDHILSFIKHALESTNSGVEVPKPRTRDAMSGLKMEDLRIIPQEEAELEAADSDDEEQDDELGDASNQEMAVTAVNLLLSILEAHPDISARTAPILNDIFSLLEPLAKGSSETMRPLAREARMVMTARLASTSAPSRKTKAKYEDGEESPQETYQKALKLLQDPILPVRAHGLLLLRQLATARRRKAGAREEPVIERALVPAILSIFMQSAQDDDSYMFLNAVQGLAAMVDGFGAEVLKALVGTYAQGLDGLGGSALTQSDVDVRTRVGEALGQVIRKCGDALPIYVNILVPPLFRVVRTSHFPTTLRTSAVSLLAQAVETNALALLPYTADLSTAMIDLLQVETVSAAPARKQDAPAPEDNESKEAEKNSKAPAMVPTMDAQPTSTNSKFPPLRRAALHFFSLLIRAYISQVYDSSSTEVPFPLEVRQRARTTLGYVAATDEDAVVRVMAREAQEELEQLASAIMGL